MSEWDKSGAGHIAPSGVETMTTTAQGPTNLGSSGSLLDPGSWGDLSGLGEIGSISNGLLSFGGDLGNNVNPITAIPPTPQPVPDTSNKHEPTAGVEQQVVTGKRDEPGMVSNIADIAKIGATLLGLPEIGLGIAGAQGVAGLYNNIFGDKREPPSEPEQIIITGKGPAPPPAAPAPPTTADIGGGLFGNPFPGISDIGGLLGNLFPFGKKEDPIVVSNNEKTGLNSPTLSEKKSDPSQPIPTGSTGPTFGIGANLSGNNLGIIGDLTQLGNITGIGDNIGGSSTIPIPDNIGAGLKDIGLQPDALPNYGIPPLPGPPQMIGAPSNLWNQVPQNGYFMNQQARTGLLNVPNSQIKLNQIAAARAAPVGKR